MADEKQIAPLNISVKKGVLNGNVYDILTPDEYLKYKNTNNSNLDNLAVSVRHNNEDIILPVIPDREYSDNVVTPGVYTVGCGPLTVYKYPKDKDLDKFKPNKIIEFSNNDSLEEILDKKEVLSTFTEPWVTGTDNTTFCPINDDDLPEMIAIKSALNAKHVDFDTYAPRFGANFPNNKRQLKNNSATLKFIKTFCDALDLDVELTIKDKQGRVANPMNKVIHVSLTDLSSTDNSL